MSSQEDSRQYMSYHQTLAVHINYVPKKAALGGVLILISHRQLSSIDSIYTTQSTTYQTIRNWPVSSSLAQILLHATVLAGLALIWWHWQQAFCFF